MDSPYTLSDSELIALTATKQLVGSELLCLERNNSDFKNCLALINSTACSMLFNPTTHVT